MHMVIKLFFFLVRVLIAHSRATANRCISNPIASLAMLCSQLILRCKHYIMEGFLLCMRRRGSYCCKELQNPTVSTFPLLYELT